MWKVGEAVYRHLPVLDVNLTAIRTNAQVLCDVCARNNISVAGIIKFSNGDLQIAKACLDGGCVQLGVSRARHLQALKEAFPDTETLLTRSPGRCDLQDCVRYADLSLHADPNVLTALNAEAEKWNTRPGIILMLDVSDLREGVDNIPALVALAEQCESLPNLHLRGVGTNLACMNGVLPAEENLNLLVEGAEAVERVIGRKLDIISGGSSINLLLLKDGISRMPTRINHLRLGGSIANPMNIRMNLPGLREDSVRLIAEIVEIHEKTPHPRLTRQKTGQVKPLCGKTKDAACRQFLLWAARISEMP